ncbi:hypothetical protein DSL72_001255 [Monilinia vaccinii-corymbosi]|uniref:Ketoreductase (KR) domain-containing protein n=1 Tax=Monilinia vaccinii-corymbosi TaxID=61207 RepID=A0A8A3P956_9HELO|nr:hypothetical protein DSL72_001255 [Monilinia vaccinii-corymbosi]
MPYKLANRNVLVTGGTDTPHKRGLGEAICLKFAAEGCNVAINYVSSEAKAKELKGRIEGEFGMKAICLRAVGAFSFSLRADIMDEANAYFVDKDMSQESDCIAVVKETIEGLGGLDIIISNAGYTRFSTFSDISAPTAEDWQKCYSTNVVAQSILMREALSTFQANEEGGVFIITSSIAGVITGGSSMPYSVTKAAQLHLMKCLAATQGPKLRVNAVLPGLLLTEWGKLYSEEDQERLKDRAYLKRVVNASLFPFMLSIRLRHVPYLRPAKGRLY